MEVRLRRRPRGRPPPRVKAPEPEPVEGPASRNTPTRPAVGTNGIASSAHPLATKVGLHVLAEGGNAFDAAVAVAAALNVVEPMMSGIGGYGALVIYDAEEDKTRFLHASSRAPATLDPTVFRPPTPNYLENRRNAMAVSTPGNVNAWKALSEDYGDLQWRSLFDPSIELAKGASSSTKKMPDGSHLSSLPFPNMQRQSMDATGCP